MGTKYKQYIGDAVYVDIDSTGSIVLTTENGINVTNSISLEPQVLDGLNRWLDWCKASIEANGFDGEQVHPDLPRGVEPFG